jgi:hypothetical protein
VSEGYRRIPPHDVLPGTEWGEPERVGRFLTVAFGGPPGTARVWGAPYRRVESPNTLEFGRYFSEPDGRNVVSDDTPTEAPDGDR